MEVNNKAMFSKFKKYIVVEPAYLESLKKSCNQNTAALDESDVNLLKVLKNKSLNANQKLNMYREILLSKKVPPPTKLPVGNNPLIRLSEDGRGMTTASSIGSDNVFDASFNQPRSQVDDLTPNSRKLFDGIDISLDMSPAERQLLIKHLIAIGEGTKEVEETPINKNSNHENSERYEPYTIPSKASRSSWSKYEDIVKEVEAEQYAKTLPAVKQVGKKKNQKNNSKK